jgi:hypothetical protein
MKRLSLRPYNGSLYVCSDEEDYQRAHKRVFGKRDVPLSSAGCEGRFTGGQGADGKWAYLIWYSSAHTLAHELSHCVLHVFERCGIDPREAGGEPFCYMLSQLMMEATE